MALAEEVEKRVFKVAKKCKIAVMGCVVNGPGEARDADLGIAGGKEYCVIFRFGAPVQRVPAENAREIFLAELDRFLG